ATDYARFSIKVPPGEHELRALAYNEANSMSSRPALLRVVANYDVTQKPNLYLLVIGINEYDNPAIALKYAVPDAELFARTLQDRTAGLFGTRKLLLLTTKQQTTKTAIRQAFQSLQDISPNDLFVFYVASHGIIDEARYHMITSNVGVLSSRGIQREALAQDELRDLIASIPSTKKVVVLDTCHSGALGASLQEALMTRGLTEVTAMKVLSRAVGSTILSASTSQQQALEGYKGHGLFTYVLAEGLNGKADHDRDGFIKTLEIANYVEDEVPELAEQIFNHAQYPLVLPTGQGFPVVRIE
ncbi:MAG: caspase family protein, partial [Woeseiaceae bacterium]|nr:caspase family protein [Woeseiaceae bacterium]